MSTRDQQQMQPSPNQLPLPERWAAAAAADPAVDSAIVRLVENSRTGNSINEGSLLKALVEHAETIASTHEAQSTVADAEAAQA